MSEEGNRNYGEELDPLLQSIYAAEAEAPLPEGVEQRVLSGVLQHLASSPSPLGPEGQGLGEAAAANVTSSTVTTKALLLVALASAGAGVALGAFLFRSAPAGIQVELDSSRPSTRDASSLSTFEDAGSQTTDVPDANQVAPDTAPVEPRKKHTQKKLNPPEPTLRAREAHVIDRARIALRRGLTDEALLALMQHERTFSSGQLSEERDVLIVEAYLNKGEHRIATRRIKLYHQRYPAGFLSERIRLAEQRIP